MQVGKGLFQIDKNWEKLTTLRFSGNMVDFGAHLANLGLGNDGEVIEKEQETAQFHC